MSHEYLERIREYYRLVDHRNNMLSNIKQVEKILQEEFPDQFHVAYQHWIPQIKTALTSDDRWLPRSDYNFDYTLNKIKEADDNQCSDSNIRKFL